jgi:hypothetical protein
MYSTIHLLEIMRRSAFKSPLSLHPLSFGQLMLPLLFGAYGCDPLLGPGSIAGGHPVDRLRYISVHNYEYILGSQSTVLPTTSYDNYIYIYNNINLYNIKLGLILATVFSFFAFTELMLHSDYVICSGHAYILFDFFYRTQFCCIFSIEICYSKNRE